MPNHILPGQADMTCGDCEHLILELDSGVWYCPEATEALVLEGWPSGSVSFDPNSSAESCPMFEQSAKSRNGAKVDSWVEHDCEATHRRNDERE